MRQLAGLLCVVCGRSVDSVVEGRFCDECGGAVHKECVQPEAARLDLSKCPACGGDPRLAQGALQREEFTPTEPVLQVRMTPLDEAEPPPPAPSKGPDAFTLNGFGTQYCYTDWFSLDSDAVLCFVICFMPIIPIGAFHAFNPKDAFLGSRFQAVRLRMSTKLLLRVFLAYWMVFPVLFGLLAVVVGFIGACADSFRGPAVRDLVVGLVVVLACGAGYYGLWRSNRRDRRIRELLGRHALGKSDPANWAPEILSTVSRPELMHGANSFAAAVPTLLAKSDRTGAMWAARLTVACEDAAVGERLTDDVLEVT
jgi:hypothetical protein